MHKRYDVIYSIESNCGCAMYLNMLGLRIASGPFDWITGANSLEERINIILNYFNSFLSFDNLKFIDKDINHKNHDFNNDYYINTENNILFLHDFKHNILLENMYSKVKEKYDRRIQRFIDNIRSKKTLLIWFSLNTNTDDNLIKELSDKLNKKFNNSIDLVVIENSSDMKIGDINSYKLSDNSSRIFLNSYDPDDPQGVLGRVDNCKKVFRQFKISYRYKLKRIFDKFYYRLLLFIVPIKSKRRKIRSIIRNRSL